MRLNVCRTNDASFLFYKINGRRKHVCQLADNRWHNSAGALSKIIV